MFISHTAWVYLHGKSILLALRANICDGKDEQIRALKSMTLRDGLSPHASMLRCGWHIENRGMYRIFGSVSHDWQRAFEKVFWMWQTLETLDALEEFHNWILDIFFNSKVVQADMSSNAKAQFPAFVANIWSTRGEWALAHNLEVQAFDVRVNTFTESNFSVLTEHVGVSASMSASTFVRREDLSHVSRMNNLAYAAHRHATKVISHATTTEWTKRFELVEALMMPKPLQNLKNQVLLGASCLKSAKTKAYICTKACAQCSICMKYLSYEQKKTLSPSTQRLHMKCFVDEELTKKVRFSNLDTEFVTLLRTAPKPKNWRVVTCNMESSGCRMLCSCGYGMRHMTCCLHVSMGIQKASNYSCFGCEEETIHVRHTSMYAALRNVDVVKRTHDDWKGVICKSLESKDIEAAFPELSLDEDLDDDAMDDEPPAPHQHGTRFQQGRRDKNANEIAYKAEKIAALKSRFFEAVNVLEAATSREDVDAFYTIIDTGVFDIKRKLPALPARTVTTVARRPAAEPKRKASSRQRLLHKKKRQEEAAPKAVVRGKSKSDAITIRSSDASSASASGEGGESRANSSCEEGFFHGSTCSETDSQTSYSSSAFV
jgi:hypothetical protein